MNIEKKINEVFSTRNFYDNNRYIKRESIENEIKSKLDRERAFYIHGISGCGKTWLVYHVLEELKIKYEYINFASIASNGSLSEYFQTKLGRIETGETETMGAQVSAVIAGGGLQHEKSYSVSKDIYMEYCKKNKKKILVFDNFEAIISNDLQKKEFANILIRIDDPMILEFDVRIIVIGTMAHMRDFFAELDNYQTLQNRIAIMREVGGFTESECAAFVSKKVLSECNFQYSDEFVSGLYKKTRGIPQSVCDYCAYSLIYALKNDIKKIEGEELINQVDKIWVSERLAGEYSIISNLMKKNGETNPKLNLVLFAISKQGLSEFSSEKIYVVISEIFQKEVGKKNIKGYLKDISSSEKNANILIKKNTDSYMIRSANTFTCMNMVLYINSNNDVCLLDIDTVNELYN